MKETELLHQLLDIAEPWQLLDVACDGNRRRIDVWVGARPERRGWFLRARPATESGPDRCWRHLNLGALACYVHLRGRAEHLPEGLPWCGEDDMPFTYALSRRVAEMLINGVKLQTISSLLGLDLTDVWRFKHGLDKGRAGLVASSASQVAPAAPAETLSGVPEATDPVWERLLAGEVNIDIRLLSLKLLLTKLREQMKQIRDPDVRMLKTHEIQRYFQRHESNLGHELGQLRRV